MGKKNAAKFLTNFAFIVVGLLLICEAAFLGLALVVDPVDSGSGPGVHVAEGINLYVKPEPKPDHPLKSEFPELFTTEAVVVAFGADWCPWCKAQARELKGPSLRYNILYVKIEDEDGKQSRWGALMDKLELGREVPVIVVIEKGEVKKVFHGFTPWAEIKPNAEKAKKNDKDDEKNNIDIGPIHIDWDDDGIDINRQRRNNRRH